MAISQALKTYPKEKNLTEQFVLPLLHRLGFSTVVNYHGKREYGKDLVFGRIDNFGHVVYFGMQVKHLDSIGLGMVKELTDDVEQAFANPFIHPHTGAQEKIFRFYITNSGSISQEFQGDFFNRITHFRPNVIIFDGPGMLALSRLASHNGLFVKEMLSGLLLEIESNRNNMDTLSESLANFMRGGPYPMVRFRLFAVTSFFERPVISDKDFQTDLQNYWHYTRTIKDIIDSTDLPFDTAKMSDRVNGRINIVLRLFPLILDLAKRIEEKALAILNSLGAEKLI